MVSARRHSFGVSMAKMRIEGVCGSRVWCEVSGVDKTWDREPVAGAGAGANGGGVGAATGAHDKG